MRLTKFVLAMILASPAYAAESADEILRKADEIRAPSETYKMEVTVESPESSLFRFEIKVGGKGASLIRTLEPRREVGKNFLMLNEEMWAYVPNIKRSLRVTLNQKLTGQAANGDISRMSWVGDYQPIIESESANEWVLLLKALKKGLTYDGIRISIEKKSYRPTHGQYLTTQGKELKKVEFTDYQAFEGKLRPSRIVIENSEKAGDISVLRIVSMKTANFPPSEFTENNLP